MKPATPPRLDRVKHRASRVRPMPWPRPRRHLRHVAWPQPQMRPSAASKPRPDKPGLWADLRTANWRHVLCVPFIYPVLLPLLLLDGFVTVYQWVCFPLCGMPRVRRSAFWVFDRTGLAYLNALEKINCAYCSYANGLIAYCREVVGRTEQYWCPIKHARRIAQPHRYYHRFVEHGDADRYRAELSGLRAQLQAMREPADRVDEGGG